MEFKDQDNKQEIKTPPEVAISYKNNKKALSII